MHVLETFRVLGAHTPPVAAGLRASTGAEGADTAADTLRCWTRDLHCCALVLESLTAEGTATVSNE